MVENFTPTELHYINPIECSECGSKAHLIRREPKNGGEERTFECEVCKRQTIITVAD